MANHAPALAAFARSMNDGAIQLRDAAPDGFVFGGQ